MKNTFHPYFMAIKGLDVTEATEYTLRSDLEILLKAIAVDEGLNVTIIHEPKKDKTRLGAPDFKIKINESVLGYLETKPIGENLDKILLSPQIAKYKQLSDNIILTDYLNWFWIKGSEVIKSEILCPSSDVGNHKAQLDLKNAKKVDRLIAGFLSTPPLKIGNAQKLAAALAVRCHDLRDFLQIELERQEKTQQEGRLYGLYDVFKRDVFNSLELKEFADAFSQTLGYGLFLAKLNAGEKTDVTLQNAKDYIAINFALIRELVTFLEELEEENYQGIRWLVEEILSIMNALDLTAIKKDLAFISQRGHQYIEAEDERQLFAKDPYIYFYEDFLNAYDEGTRKRRGVYYTPPPVVQFIIQTVNSVLKDTFGVSDGLADRRRVTVLDFATGTGTFLREVVQHILETVSPGVRNQIVKEHVLKNLYGFEFLIAPYTIAHLKLSQLLKDEGYTMQSEDRLNIYLTNTLEPIEPQQNYFLPALSHEMKEAQKIKEQPVLVITGNPPYLGHSMNKGSWITDLIKAYKQVDGKPLGEQNSKWLQDDYVKFIRFAQWKMEQVEEGVVGIITNHSFLDNPTFRGMRQSLMQTFNQIYLMDLHGNTKKKEKTPEGDKDENVFDIEQGVAISLLVKKKGLPRAVYHANLWGTRKEKYRKLLLNEEVSWQELNSPTPPFYLFIPHDGTFRSEYERGWKITDIFSKSVQGFQTHRDHFAIAYEKSEMEDRVNDMLDETITDQDLRKKYDISDNRDWKLLQARASLRGRKNWTKDIVSCAYRPFDTRWCFFGKEFMDYPRKVFLQHCHLKNNVILGVGRAGNAIPERPWELVTIADTQMDANIFRRGGVDASPLYIYPEPDGEDTQKDIYGKNYNFQGKERIENLTPVFRESSG